MQLNLFGKKDEKKERRYETDKNYTCEICKRELCADGECVMTMVERNKAAGKKMKPAHRDKMKQIWWDLWD